MSGLITVKLDQLFKALTENSPITKELIVEARQEYAKLRSTAENGEKLEHNSAKKRNTQRHSDFCSTCKGNVSSHQDLVTEIKQLQTELNLKSQMCADLQEQLRCRQLQNVIQRAHPQMADLNDPNRALKIGEMYSQLYDDQWTEAYQYLDNVMNLREDKILETLQRIIRGAYMFCQDISKAQLTNLGGEIACPLSTWTEKKRLEMIDNGPDVSGKLVEITRKYRKSSSTECVPNLQKSFSDTILPTFFEGNEYRNEYVVRYAERSVAVSWYMLLQEPPMVLISKIIRKSDFDSHLFRPYTKSGDKYDFLVWPALLLHENGPVVEKGVAQPLDSGISPLSLRSQRTPVAATSSPRPGAMKKTNSNNPALRGTPWGSQMFAANDPHAPSPSIELPTTPTSVNTPRDSARGTPQDPPIVTYPSSSKRTPDKKDVLTASWKQTNDK